ncbi:MAG: copper amine oxidase N-terminal domain-containing protein [Defluviitaleaceae bacterium]|nr:copper amine oxidase N-terminal domain-containing protein [Defluviitaleaceae bacterium]
MRKKIIAGLLALTLVVVPVTAFANTTVTIQPENAIAAISQIRLVAIGGETFLPLRDTAVQFGGEVTWVEDTRTVNIAFSAPALAATLGNMLGVNLTEFAQPGNFVLSLQEVNNRLVVVGGPADGVVTTARLVPHAGSHHFMFPMPELNPLEVLANPLALAAGLHEGLIEAALSAVSTRPVTYNIQPNGTININIGIQPR